MTDTFVRMIKDDEGATLVEYGLVVALIAVAAIGAMTTLSNSIQGSFNNIASKITAAGS